MGKSLARGGVLVLFVWDDDAVNMLWLDLTYPTDCTKDGCYRGTCAIISGVPSDVEYSAPNAYVVYSNIAPLLPPPRPTLRRPPPRALLHDHRDRDSHQEQLVLHDYHHDHHNYHLC